MARANGGLRPLTRREWLRLAGVGVAFSTVSASGWIETLASAAAPDPARRRSCILLWMSGGPSQIDTFDPKPGQANGGPTQAIETSVPGLKIAEHLPKLAKFADDLALIRTMATKEGDHGRATFFLRTGYMPNGPIRYPALGSLVAKELERADDELPSFVSIAPVRNFNAAAFGPGFLGPRYAPLIVGDRPIGPVQQGAAQSSLKVEDMAPPSGIDRARADDRLGLLGGLDSEFLARHPGGPPASHRSAYERAMRMVRSKAAEAFDLDREPARLRDAYGRNDFGQGCLLARRLVERGVPFVEVTLSRVAGAPVVGWDTHQANFDAVKRLCGVLDPAWSTLMDDLRSRGLLDTTLIVWMGEFGRTPKINPRGGRDHFPNAWSAALAGGGIAGGQAYGRTSDDGMTIEENGVSVPDLMATICTALGIDPRKQNESGLGRPIRIADPQGHAIEEVLG
jgi:hypothetical protein